MIGFFSQSPDCNDEQTIKQIYSTYNDPYNLCMLDRSKIRACKIYFATTCVNFAFIVVTTAIFVNLARGSNDILLTLPIPESPSHQSLYRQWKRTSLQRRSIVGTVLGATGHLVFSTAVFLSQSYYGAGTCEIYLWGVVLGFYTWIFALCWRSYRLYFLLRLNMLKTRYGSIQDNVEQEQLVIEDPEYQWLMHHKDCKSIRMVRPLSVYLLLFFIMAIVCGLTEWQMDGCQVRWGVYLLLGFVGFFLLVVTPCVIWRSRRYKDLHGIRNEILIDAVAGIFCCILTSVWYHEINGLAIRSPSGSYYNRFFAPRNWLAFLTTVGHITSIVYPIWKLVPNRFFWRLHFRRDNHSSHHSNGPGGIHSPRGFNNDGPMLPQTPETLEQLLRDAEATKQLIELAVRDFSSENVLAYKEYLKLVDRLQYQRYGRVVKRFTRRYYSSASTLVDFQPLDNIDATSIEKDDNLLASPIYSPLLDDFAKFYDTYIRQGAPLQVNISYRARNELDSFFARARVTSQADSDDDTVTMTGTDLITPWSHNNKLLAPLLPVHTPSETSSMKRKTRWSWSVATEFPLCEPLSDEMITTTGSQLTLIMFEPARNELFWNIFASVFPKYVNSQ